MLIKESEVEVSSSGMLSTDDLGINLDGVMFDSLINGIYSNKIAAGIREYSTNAKDAHSEAGIPNKQFEIGLPTEDNAYFECRDYGESLTHEEVVHTFSVLGKSTKRNSNEVTGCLGLGSQSAFAYANMFSITTWKDGRKSDYSCYKGADGRPKVSKITEVPSSEPTGLRVSYAVKQADVDAFNQEASIQLMGFDPQPIVTRKTRTYKPINEKELLIEGSDWKLFKKENDSREQAIAVQGSVSYPINANNKNLVSTMERKYDYKKRTPYNYNYSASNTENMYVKIERLLEKTSIIVTFPIGQLKMTTSRESLGYDDYTCLNIINKLEDVIKDIEVSLDKKYENFDNLGDARRFNELSNKEGGLKILENITGLNIRKWKGQEVYSTFVLEEREDEKDLKTYIGERQYSNGRSQNYLKEDTRVEGSVRLIYSDSYSTKFGEIKSSFTYPTTRHNGSRKVLQICNMSISSLDKTHILFEVSDECIKLSKNNLMREFWYKFNQDNKFLWVKVRTLSDASKFLKLIHNKNDTRVHYLHKQKPLKLVKGVNTSSNTGTLTERTFRYITPLPYCMNSGIVSGSFDTVKGNIPAIFYFKNKFYLTQDDLINDINGQNEGTTRSNLYEWIKDVDDKIAVINSNQIKFFKDNRKLFIPIEDYMKSKWIKDNPNWKKSYETVSGMTSEESSTELNLIKKLIRLDTNLGIRLDRFKDSLYNDNKVKTIKEKLYARVEYQRKPKDFHIIMEKEIKNAEKANHKSTLKRENLVIDYIKDKPTLKFMMTMNTNTIYGSGEENYNAAMIEVFNKENKKWKEVK